MQPTNRLLFLNARRRRALGFLTLLALVLGTAAFIVVLFFGLGYIVTRNSYF